MLWCYAARLSREKTKIPVNFPILLMAHTYGDDEPEALERAGGALETMLMAMIEVADAA
jgi:hypothetical protein